MSKGSWEGRIHFVLTGRSFSISQELQGSVSATTNNRFVFSIRLAWNNLTERVFVFRKVFNKGLFAHTQTHTPGAVPTVLQHVEGVGSVGEVELTVNRHAAAAPFSV